MPAAPCRPSPRRMARRVWSRASRPRTRRAKEGFGGGLALDGGQALRRDRLWHGRRPRSQQRRRRVDASGSASRSAARRRPPAARSIFVSTDNMLYALNGDDGQQLWTARGLPQPATLLSNVSPAVSGGIVVAPFPAGDVAAYRGRQRQAGLERFAARSSETTAAGILGDPARPVIDQGVVFAVSHGGKMIAVSEFVGRAAVDAESRPARRCRGRRRHRLCRRSERQAHGAGPRRRQGALDHAASRARRAGTGRCSPAASCGSSRRMALLVGADASSGPGASASSISTRRCSSRLLWPAAACISWPTTPR